MADTQPLLGSGGGDASQPGLNGKPPETQVRALASAIATLTLGILGR